MACLVPTLLTVTLVKTKAGRKLWDKEETRCRTEHTVRKSARTAVQDKQERSA